MLRRIRERLRLNDPKEKEKNPKESYFSFTQNGRISIPTVGERILVPARADESLMVELEFFSTYVVLHLKYDNQNQLHAQWGRYNSFGESGDLQQREMRHAVIVVDKNGQRSDNYVGTVPQTEMHFDYTKTAQGAKVMRLYGPDKSWFLRWNDIHTKAEALPVDKIKDNDDSLGHEGELRQLPLPLILR